MLSMKPFKHHHLHSPLSIFNPLLKKLQIQHLHEGIRKVAGRKLVVVVKSSENQAGGGGEKKMKEERKSFLSLEEAGLVEISGLSTHERFLCRLTISSLNLLRVISEEEGIPIEELNAGKICDWFMKDKLKREQNLDSAVLQWDDNDLQF